MLSLVVSTIAYFVASFFIRRRFEEMGLPRGLTRGLMIFCLAVAVAYGVGAAVDWGAAHI